MCDLPVPCQCTLEERARLRAEHHAPADALSALAYRLSKAGQITEAEADLLYSQSTETWDDAIHIASPDDPLRSLCGSYGRNLCDLPQRPNSDAGCWGCLQRADELAKPAQELVTA